MHSPLAMVRLRPRGRWTLAAALLLAMTATAQEIETIDDVGREAELRAATTEATREQSATAPPFQAPPLREPDMEWVEHVLDSLTLEEKIGQMMMPVWNERAGMAQVTDYKVGGFCFSANRSDYIAGVSNSLQLVSELPLLFSADCEAGSGARVRDGTAFPMNMALAASGRLDLAREQGIVTARECRAIGIHIAFGPVLDTNTEPINPIIGIRAYSDDPETIARYARAYVEGAASAGLLTTFKHFPGHGATTGDSHHMLPVVDVDCAELDRVHLAPYEKLFREIPGSLVMTAHVWYPCLDPGTRPWPATLSQAALGDVLRQRMRFDGTLVSDSFAMRGVQDAASLGEGVVASVAAGLDIVLMPPRLPEAFEALRAAVAEGRLDAARIDEATRRVLVLKSRVGLPEAAWVDPDARARTIAHPDHAAVAEEIGQQALAAARVQDSVLPIARDARVLCVALEASGRIFYIHPATRFTDPLLEAFPNAVVREVELDVDEEEAHALGIAALQFDRVVVTNRGWRPNTPPAQRVLIERLLESGTPVVYFSFGSPYHLLEMPALQNYYCSFSSHYASQAEAVRVLTGESRPMARWPVEISF
ncbi:MAG: hypothetical protein KF858_11955 [Candidatus Sumerlaeia bacterium]|nr:hypothetical protein [Candidatus Sumerlaeia bacterium]